MLYGNYVIEKQLESKNRIKPQQTYFNQIYPSLEVLKDHRYSIIQIDARFMLIKIQPRQNLFVRIL